MNWANLAAQGGVASLILALVGVGKLGLDWWRSRHDVDRGEKAGALTDASAANAVVLKSMESVHAENERLVKRVAALELESGSKDTKIRELQEKLGEAQQKIQEIADELQQLKSSP